jgi:hypothetical protein
LLETRDEGVKVVPQTVIEQMEQLMDNRSLGL